VVIRGESGTGKELVARAIVSLGPRREKPFVSINCAALPENLIESELFGHEKGAFTDARTARAGHIELAHTGTLFLDEIATLTLPLQSKLLRVLEDRAVTRLGGRTAKRIEFRLITAGASVRTFTTASTWCPSCYLRCENERATSPCWPTISSISTVPATT
jgi:transcriptional regulator with PAS, ATPase and Fis domain